VVREGTPFVAGNSAAKPSWHRLMDCSVFAYVDCFGSEGEYAEYPNFEGVSGVAVGAAEDGAISWSPAAAKALAARAAALEVSMAARLKAARFPVTTVAAAAAGKGKGAVSSWSPPAAPPAAAVACGAPPSPPPSSPLPSASSSASWASDEAAVTEAYDAALSGLARDAASRRTALAPHARAAFTMADKAYASQVGSYARVGIHHHGPVFMTRARFIRAESTIEGIVAPRACARR
jgi:hypothetical protein